MKKILSVILALISTVMMGALTACKSSEPEGVTLSYSNPSDIVALLKSGNLEYGLLAEPAATKLTKIANDKTWHRLSVQELYDGQTQSYPQAVLMVKQSVLATYPEMFSNADGRMVTKIQGAKAWAIENPSTAAAIISSKLAEGLTPAFTANDITIDVINNCKIYWEDAVDAKESVKAYLNDIINVAGSATVKPAVSVTDEFFYDGQNANGEFLNNTLNFYMPDGAPALAFADFMGQEGEFSDDFGTGLNVEYHVVDSNSIAGLMQNGSADAIVMPINAASKLYKANASDPYKMVSVITHGNLYIMSTSEFTIDDLKGKTLGVFGQGLVPDLTLKAVLSKNGITIK